MLANEQLMERESQLRERLEKESQYLLRAQRTARIATFHRDRGSRLSTSPEFSWLLGLDPAAKVDEETMLKTIHPLDLERVRGFEEDFYRHRQAEVDHEYEFRILRDGEVRWVRWVLRRENDDKGSFQSLLGTVQDITEQRAADRRARALALVADRRVKQLTRLSEELEASRKATSDAYRVRSEFLAAMSHDIRTPLNGLLGMMDLMSLGSLDTSQQERLRVAQLSADQLKSHIEDIIDMANADAAYQPPQTSLSGHGVESCEKAASLQSTMSHERVFSGVQRPLVLVVDDIETNRMVLAQMLDVLGCHVELACDGDEAIEMIQTERFDAVMLDILMPRLSGREVVEAVRRQPQFATLPITAVTAHANRRELHDLVRKGFTAALTKPVMRTEVAELLASQLTAFIEPLRPAIEGTSDEKATANVDEADVLDEDYFRAIFASLPADRRAMLLNAAVADIERLTHEMTHAHAAGDSDTLQQAAHSLKGVAGNFGARALFQTIVAFREASPPLAETLLKQIREQGVKVIARSHTLFAEINAAE
ncbi:response regulator [Halomonas sp. HMF6819]|uniref:response regulator n=1 Tax=Halomonas sp. HMF6819 TaxID=3373085 RepID=UPI00378D50E9